MNKKSRKRVRLWFSTDRHRPGWRAPGCRLECCKRCLPRGAGRRRRQSVGPRPPNVPCSNLASIDTTVSHHVLVPAFRLTLFNFQISGAAPHQITPSKPNVALAAMSDSPSYRSMATADTASGGKTPPVGSQPQVRARRLEQILHHGESSVVLPAASAVAASGVAGISDHDDQLSEKGTVRKGVVGAWRRCCFFVVF